MSRMLTTRRSVVMGTGAAMLLALSACSSGGSGGYGGSGGGGGGGSGATISITAPKDHATVSEPFTLTVRSSEAMGPTDSGKDHFHLTFDGNAQDYTVETKPSVMINNLKPGQHRIKVTLQHADHSPVGPAAQVTVTVTSGGSGMSPSPSPSGSAGTNGY